MKPSGPVPDDKEGKLDEPLPGLDYDHLCPKCGTAPWAPADGSGRFCEYCGWVWQLGLQASRGWYDARRTSGQLFLPRTSNGMPSVWIEGRPATFLTGREGEWKRRIKDHLFGMWRHPRLDFRVEGWKRGGNYFDLDNLCKPILDFIGHGAESVWARFDLDESPGLYLSEETPPEPPPAVVALHLADPPTRSRKDQRRLNEITAQMAIHGDDALGVALGFDSATTRVGDFGFEGPIKAVLDALDPVFGQYAQGAKDYRMHELRITRGGRPDSHGVSVAIWVLQPQSLDVQSRGTSIPADGAD